MLILLSDLHVTDETTSHNVNPEAFEILRKEIALQAKERKVKEAQIVFLGDIFDLMRTSWWHANTKCEDRPWNGTLDPRTGMNGNGAEVERQFNAVLEEILKTKTAKAVLGLVDSLADLGLPEPPKATYVIGNHDRAFNNFASLRQKVLSRSGRVPLSVAREYVAPAYGVLGRHGHEWDENNHGWEFHDKVLRKSEKTKDRFAERVYDVMSIGEVVTTELMSGLIHNLRLRDPGNDPAFKDMVEGLKEVNNLRPMLRVFEWLEWFGGGDRVRRYGERLHGALRASLDGVLESQLAKKWDGLKRDILVSGDLVDRLGQVRSVLLGDSFAEFQQNMRRMEKLEGVLSKLSGDGDELPEGAWEDFRNQPKERGIQYVIYGHSHRPRRDYFSGEPTGRVQMYLNTGTFLPLIERAQKRSGFAQELRMTMLFVFRADEDTDKKAGGQSVDVWNGMRRKQYA